MGGPAVVNTNLGDGVNFVSDCDLSSITGNTSSIAIARDRSSGSNTSAILSDTSSLPMPDLMNSAAFERKNLHTVLKEKGGNAIYCNGFLFTEPHKTRKFPSKNSQLTLENVIDNAGALHFVFFSKHQAYRCRTGMYPHGTVLFRSFYDAMQQFPRRRHKLFIYFADKSYSNNFLMVINNSEHSKRFPWI